MKKKRIVVTGVGLITPLGLNVDITWKAILAGESGVSPITQFDTSAFKCQISASVKGFDCKNYDLSGQNKPTKDSHKMDLFIQYGIAAAIEAIEDSQLTITKKNTHRIGVAVGSGIGGLPFIEANHTKLLTKEETKKRGGGVSPYFIPGAITNMPAGYISIRYGLKGPNMAIVTACTTGTHNIGLGARTILYGDADIMIVGGSEMATTPLGLGGFDACQALSRRNDKTASRPWDKGRDGFVLGDGAGILVLEEYEHAKQRNAPIYAELIGFGMSADAYSATSPDPEGKGAMNAMLNALHDAHLEKEKIAYINAHATSTPLGDKLELRAIHQVFAEHTKKLAISATKSMTGHLLGAAGAVEAIFTILALRDKKIPPTINLEHPGNPPGLSGSDSDYEGINLVPDKYQEQEIDYALSNSFGFGGTNASLIFARYPKVDVCPKD